MVTSANSRLFRFLLLLITRLRLSAGRIALALRSGFSLSLKSILAFAYRRGQSRIQLHASNVPGTGSNSIGQLFEREYVGEHDRASLATTPMGLIDRWREEIARQRARASNRQPDFSKLQPATPERGSQRYDKPRTYNRAFRGAQRAVPAGQQTLLESLLQLGDGWRRHVHPEGVALFYHEKLHIFTENDISDPAKEEEIFLFGANLVGKAIQMDNVTLDELTEIVLNVDESRYCHYYFVDHTHRLLFWVDEMPVRLLNVSPRGNSGYSHIKYMVESHYWAHCEYYPHNHTLPKGAFEGLRGTLNYAKIDTITTDTSSSPFGQDEIVAMLDLVNSLKDDEKISDPHSVWAVARLMAYFTENQFQNFYGQTCARLDADTPLFEKRPWNRHMLFETVNLFLLGSPNEHALRLQRVWVDGTIIQPRWKDFINRLTTELGRYTIFSTVMLAVNFSFLSVPGVVTPHSAAGPIQIIIYCSVVSTVASIVFSFGLLNVYSNPRLLIARNVLDAMATLDHRRTGLAWLAITHSLPLASLIWSITLFTAALAVQIFDPKQPATVATLGAEFLIIILFVIMGVRVMRLFTKGDSGNAGGTPKERGSPATEPQPV